jgi:hypothetical protein
LEKIMKSKTTLLFAVSALVCAVALISCSSDTSSQSSGDDAALEPVVEVAFTKQVDVFGVPVIATNTTGDDKLLHAAGVLAQFLDNDADGEPDNPLILQGLLDANGTIVMTKTQGEGRTIPRDSRPRGQGLYDEETHPNAREEGIFDASLEEILHLVTDHGWGGAYPEVFGRVPGTEITAAMDIARGGQFDGPPPEYPEGAWYTYDDETCDYDCMTSEYIYWTFTSLLGAQDFPGRLDQIGREWRLNTPELLEQGDPAAFAILTRPEYNLPTVAPDGNYTGTELTIEPYSHE